MRLRPPHVRVCYSYNQNPALHESMGDKRDSLDEARAEEQAVSDSFSSTPNADDGVNGQMATARTAAKEASIIRYSVAGIVWLVMLLFLSIFSFAYGLGQSIPEDNSLGLNQSLLN